MEVEVVDMGLEMPEAEKYLVGLVKNNFLNLFLEVPNFFATFLVFCVPKCLKISRSSITWGRPGIVKITKHNYLLITVSNL